MDRRDVAKAVGLAVAGAVAGGVKVEAAAASLTSTRVRRVVRMLELGDDDGLFSAEHVSNTPWDRAGAKGAFDELDSVFSNMRMSVIEATEAGDKVTVRWRLRGDFTGSFGPVKGQGQAVDVTGINVYRFAGDKIVENWGELDFATLMQQVRVAGVEVPEEECEETTALLAAN